MDLISRDQLNREIVVWMARGSQAPSPLTCLDFLLEEPERERAARFRFAEDRARFVLGRCLVRRGLGLCLDRKPETIRLGYGQRDRPVFPDDESIQFSIAHTGDIVAVAFAANARVGIDLEFIKPAVDLPELAGRILSADDLRKFQALPRHDALPVFFRAWTRKEAYLKARSEGIGDGLQAVSVAFGEEEVTPLTDSRDPSGSSAWRLHNLTMAPGYMGAVACDVPDRRVNCLIVQLSKADPGPEIILKQIGSGNAEVAA